MNNLCLFPAHNAVLPISTAPPCPRCTTSLSAYQGTFIPGGPFLRLLAFAADLSLLVFASYGVNEFLRITHVVDLSTLFILKIKYLLFQSAPFSLVHPGIRVALQDFFLGHAALIPLFIDAFFLGLFYFVLFEASRKRASLGKVLVLLSVISIERGRLTVFQAALRFLSKFFFTIPLIIAVAAPYTFDLFGRYTGVLQLSWGSASLVCLAAAGGILVLQYGPMIIGPSKRGFHDVVADSFVERDRLKGRLYLYVGCLFAILLAVLTYVTFCTLLKDVSPQVTTSFHHE